MTDQLNHETDAAASVNTGRRTRPALPRREPARSPSASRSSSSQMTARREGRSLLPDDDRHRRRRRALEGDHMFGLPSTDDYVIGRGMNHFNVLRRAPTAELIAEWHNRLQELAAHDPPRHPRDDLDRPAPLVHRQPRSRACSPARSRSGPRRSASRPIGDEALVERFGDIARQEYTAVGIRVALHPQIDLATEPRWSRAAADVRRRRRRSPGDGRRLHPRLPGRRARPRLGRDDDEALPRRRPPEGRRGPALRVRPRAGLPGRPVRAAPEAVRGRVRGGHAARSCRTTACPSAPSTKRSASASTSPSSPGLLRERYGFDGIVCTDWGLHQRRRDHRRSRSRPARGASSTSPPRERMKKVIDAGVDQFGGEAIPEMLVELVRAARSPRSASTSRRDASCARSSCSASSTQPYVDAERRRARSSARAEFVAAGEAAQRAAITLLVEPRADGCLGRRAPRRCRSHAGSASTSRASRPRSPRSTARSSRRPAEADVAILRLQAPFEERADDLRELLPLGFARLHRRADRPRARGRGSRADRRRRASSTGRRSSRRSSTTSRRSTANWGANPRALLDVLVGDARAQGQAAVRPAVEHGRRRGEPPRRAVRHGRPAVPLRARPELLGLTDARRPIDRSRPSPSATDAAAVSPRHPLDRASIGPRRRTGVARSERGTHHGGTKQCTGRSGSRSSRAGGPARASSTSITGTSSVRGRQSRGRRRARRATGVLYAPPSARSSSASSCWRCRFGIWLGRWVVAHDRHGAPGALADPVALPRGRLPRQPRGRVGERRSCRRSC